MEGGKRQWDAECTLVSIIIIGGLWFLLKWKQQFQVATANCTSLIHMSHNGVEPARLRLIMWVLIKVRCVVCCPAMRDIA